MNHLIAKKKGRNSEFIKLMSDEEVFNLPDDLDSPREYDTNYKLEEDEWFAINNFSDTDYCLSILTEDFNSTDHLDISNSEYSQLKYLLSYQEENFYFFQKLTPSQTIRRKWFKLSNNPELMVDDPIIVVKKVPDAIYDRDKDILYFQKLPSISSIFPDIGELYREATEEDTEEFLQNDFIDLADGYGASRVKTANRKRIAMAMDTFSGFSEVQKNSIYNYIRDYCTDLEFSDQNKTFTISSEENLKKLLFGIEQRYYTTPVGNERRLANSVTNLE